MTASISNDLRERVVAAVSSGAARFEVAASSVVKWSQRHRATGSVLPDRMGGYCKHILKPHRDFIAERLAQNPHLTLHGLKDELASRGLAVSHNTIWKFIRSQGMRFTKKTLFALAQARADVARRKERWRTLQQHLDPEQLVFIDETWIKTFMGHFVCYWPLTAHINLVGCAAADRAPVNSARDTFPTLSYLVADG